MITSQLYASPENESDFKYIDRSYWAEIFSFIANMCSIQGRVPRREEGGRGSDKRFFSFEKHREQKEGKDRDHKKCGNKTK